MHLFLDRDGVINARKVDGYIQHASEFKFLDGVLEAMPILAELFEQIIVVTNQQGIGKGLMTEADLANVHQAMIEGIKAAGGRIDAVFYCPHLKSAACSCRKPLPGMAFQAKELFPDIRFEDCVLVGDSYSDIAFGMDLGMQVFYIKGKAEDVFALEALPNLIGFDNLLSLAHTF